MFRYTNHGRLLALVALLVTVYLLHVALNQAQAPHSALLSAAQNQNSTNGDGETYGLKRADRQRPFFHKIQKRPNANTDEQDSTDILAQKDTHPLRTANLDVEFPGVEVNARGHVLYDPTAHASVHPIRLLMQRARKQVEQLEARIKAVTGLQDVVDDYTAAWGMKPPKGIETWYKFVKDTKSVPLPSLFPMAHKPFLAYLSLPPSVLRERLEKLEEHSIKNKRITLMYSLTFVPDGQGDEGTACDEGEEWYPEDYHERGRGRVKVSGGMAWSWRCNNTLNLILPILPKLPPEFFTMDPPLKMVFNADDGPRGQTHHDFQQKAETYGKSGKLWPPAQLHAAEQALRWTHGWQWTCPHDSPLKQQAISTVLNRADSDKNSIAGVKSFIGDFYMASDVCYNPELRDQNSFAIADERFANVALSPQISVSRTLRHTDICMVPLDAVHQDVPLVRWKDKERAMVFWRGSPTGVSHRKGIPWRNAQRHRLNFFANNESEEAYPVLVERDGAVHTEHFRVKDMNSHWFDVGLAGGPTQCSREDGSCDELRDTVPWKTAVRGPESLSYKYAVDVDGNAWSSRFRRLLLSNNCVLKSTAFTEWFNDILVPWYHYVPIRHDYADMYDIMAFFEGAPDGSTKGNSELAEEIAMNGVKFVHSHWRDADMQSFMILLFLEYFRLMSDDRQAASHA